MRIGLVPNLDRSMGGMYQYSLTLIGALERALRPNEGDSGILFTWTELDPELDPFRHWWEAGTLDVKHPIKGWGKVRPVFARTRARLRAAENADARYAPVYRTELRDLFQRSGVNAMLYPVPTTMCFEACTPYAFAVHDLQHRLQPEFPEVSANGEWEAREYLYRNAIRHAGVLIADSETGKEDILTCYGSCGAREEQVVVIPYLPAHYLPDTPPPADEVTRIRAKYGLPDRYLFYPAQFWPHKNHARIVQALSLLKRETGEAIPVAFAGTHSGDIRTHTVTEVRKIACEEGLDGSTIFLGYVPDEDMSALYAGARALVMPTFFGPTNIPVLEAWSLGCPVLTSDIRGIREQTGDAAILADPRRVDSIAEAIQRLWTDDAFCAALIQKGTERLAGYTPDDFDRRVVELVDRLRAL